MGENWEHVAISVQPEFTLNYLFQVTMEENWDEVVRLYRRSPLARNAKLTAAEATVLHVAIYSYRSGSRDGIRTSHIREMIESIPAEDLHQTLSKQKNDGDTILHLAAVVGWADLCEFIALKDSHLITVRNRRKETTLFTAARRGNLKAFIRLHEVHGRNFPDKQPDYSLCRKDDGTTILHAAIEDEHFELAYQIMRDYKELMTFVNEEGHSPLYVLATKPNAFKSSSNLGLYESIIYKCLSIEELKKHTSGHVAGDGDNTQGGEKKYPNNYETHVGILNFLSRPIIKSAKATIKKLAKYLREEGNQQTDQKRYQEGEDENSRYYPANYTTCIMLFKFGMMVILTVLGVGYNKIKKIREEKQRNMYASEIMKMLIEHEKSCAFPYKNDGQEPLEKLKRKLPEELNLHLDEHADAKSEENKRNKPDDYAAKKDTVLLKAAEMGILEMVKQIITTFRITIQDIDSNRKNVPMLAAENRHIRLFDYLLSSNLPDYIFHQVDNRKNNILHLAANLGESNPWHIPGNALQMQWEIKWFEHVTSKIPRLSPAHTNEEGDTVMKVFAKSHKELVEKSTAWLIKTSESCSLIAALIATVAFATSATVPGGLNQDNGHPIMGNHTAFDVFSISSLIALCLSVTALVFFLGIITSRCELHDFKSALPKRLLMGLTALFASIAAMLVSFCAGHTFILRDDMRIASVPIYAIAGMPVTLFALAQLPLYFDLLWANCVRVPLRSYKFHHH